MTKFMARFENIVSRVLLVFAMVIISYQVVQLLWNSVQNFAVRFHTTGLQYVPERGREIAVMFFNILLMMEIMQTIKVFASSHINKVRIILIVCMIAVSRKILALGETTIDPMAEFALGALVLSLAVGYHLVSKYAVKEQPDPPHNRRHV